jgi:hypothetical protein
MRQAGIKQILGREKHATKGHGAGSFAKEACTGKQFKVIVSLNH